MVLKNRIITLKREGAGKEDKEKIAPCDLRLQKDWGEDLSEVHSIRWRLLKKEDGTDNLREVDLTVRPIEGYYQGHTYELHLSFSLDYPMSCPKLTCSTRIWHPNIDLDGNVCLLRGQWKPTFTAKTILFNIECLFISPNPDDPLNTDAAKQMREDPRGFERKVRQTYN